MRRAAYILFLFVLGGPVASFYGCRNAMFHSKLESEGKSVTGIIDSGEARSSTKRGISSTNYKLTVGYTPTGGKLIWKDFTVTEEFFKSRSAGSILLDDKVDIRYLPDDPEKAIVVGGSTEWGYLWWVGLLCSAVATVAVVICYKNDVFTEDGD